MRVHLKKNECHVKKLSRVAVLLIEKVVNLFYFDLLDKDFMSHIIAANKIVFFILNSC